MVHVGRVDHPREVVVGSAQHRWDRGIEQGHPAHCSAGVSERY